VAKKEINTAPVVQIDFQVRYGRYAMDEVSIKCQLVEVEQGVAGGKI